MQACASQADFQIQGNSSYFTICPFFLLLWFCLSVYQYLWLSNFEFTLHFNWCILIVWNKQKFTKLPRLSVGNAQRCCMLQGLQWHRNFSHLRNLKGLFFFHSLCYYTIWRTWFSRYLSENFRHSTLLIWLLIKNKKKMEI